MTPLGIAIVYAILAYGATRVSKPFYRDLAAYADGPEPGKPPRLVLVGISAIIGAALAARHATLQEVMLACLLTLALVACCCSDMTCGLVPDAFTLWPLGAVLAFSAFSRDAKPLVSALVMLVPLGVAAYLSRGRGMGWGDVKLVTLAGAVLGAQAAIFAFSGACLAAATIALLQRRQREPIAFVPYIAGSAALALALPHSL